MGTLAVTATQTEVFQMAKALEKAAQEAGYRNEVNATLTIDNAPATGSVSVVYASGTTFTV